MEFTAFVVLVSVMGSRNIHIWEGSGSGQNVPAPTAPAPTPHLCLIPISVACGDEIT